MLLRTPTPATDAIMWFHSQTLVPITWKHVLILWMRTLYYVHQLWINSWKYVVYKYCCIHDHLPFSRPPSPPSPPSLPSLLLQSCVQIIVGGCRYYVCDVKPEGVVTIVNVMAHLVQLYPNHFAQVIPDFLSIVIKNLLKEEVHNILYARCILNFCFPSNLASYCSIMYNVMLHRP